jgi:hypothetical protein
MSERPVRFADVESCVEATIGRIGRKICLGTPLGLGKANHLINEFFRRAREDPRLDLRIFTALTLDLAPRLRQVERRGQKVALLAQVNRNLPFMYGDAAVPPDYFDALVDQPKYDFPLFGPSNI